MKTLGAMTAMYYGFENVYLFDVDLAKQNDETSFGHTGLVEKKVEELQST